MATKQLTYNATLLRRVNHTPELASFFVRYDEPLAATGPLFLPGQYVALGLNNKKEPALGSVRRAMSICSAPEETDAFEFYIRWVKRPESPNPLTHLLWRRADGDRIFMTRKPVGKFTLEDTVGSAVSTSTTVFVAAGTGLAPFVSMLRSARLRDASADMSRFVLLHGASYASDLCYREELEGYRTRHGLHYFPTVSRPRESSGWAGDRGRVEDFFLPDRLKDLEARIGVAEGTLHGSRVKVLICGLQGTIAQSILRLAGRGFVPFDRKIRKALELGKETPSTVWWEQYDSEPVIDLNDEALVTSMRRDLTAAVIAAP